MASNLNVVAGQTTPNLATVGLGANGSMSLYNNAGATHLIAAVQAYVVPQAPTPTGLLVDLEPARLLDTRPAQALPGGGKRTVQVAGRAGVHGVDAEVRRPPSCRT